MSKHVFKLLSLFPEMFDGYKTASLVGKAAENNIVSIDTINIRDFSTNKHHTVDDRPFGGGAGMIMSPEPIARAIESCMTPESKVVYMSPSGTPFNQVIAREMLDCRDMIIICGRYEGIDARIIDKYVDYEISIGDYVLAGGEVPAMVMMDAIIRLIPDVMGNAESLEEESFERQLLEYPQYTRPQEFDGMSVPEVLLGGNHRKIKEWQHEMAVKKTAAVRPDLLNHHKKTK